MKITSKQMLFRRAQVYMDTLGIAGNEPNFPHSSLDGTMFCIYNENC